MIKLRFYLDKDKETVWLNDMAQDGWSLTGFFAGFYHFEPCEKGIYQYQVDFTDQFFSISNNYREFMQEMGIQIVANWGFWTFLRKPASEGEFQLYTDVSSTIEHYKKIRRMFKIATILELIFLFIELLAASRGFAFGYAAALLIGALVLALANICFKTNDIIVELTERKTGIASEKKNRRFSLPLLCGLLLNSLALMMNTTDNSLSFIKHGIQIAAIVLMAVGIFMTVRRRGK